jgi:dolichol-phosphate mannosyltransferase
MMSPKVGLVIPCYNEKETIAALVTQVKAHVPGITIIVVDDSPDDLTERAVAPLLDDRIHVLHRRAKGGRGSAVIEGLKFLMERGVDVALEMDADFSHPPAQMPRLIEKLTAENLDLLIASRYIEGSRIENWPLSRKVFSALANWLAHRVLSVPVHDYTNGYRCYSRKAVGVIVENCGRLGTGFISLSEILVAIYYRGLRVAEVPTVFVNRVRGESSLNLKEITNAMKGLVGISGLKNKLVKEQHEHVARLSH